MKTSFRKLFTVAVAAALLTGLFGMTACAAQTRPCDSTNQTRHMGNTDCPRDQQGHMQGGGHMGPAGSMMQGGLGGAQART